MRRAGRLRVSAGRCLASQSCPHRPGSVESRRDGHAVAIPLVVGRASRGRVVRLIGVSLPRSSDSCPARFRSRPTEPDAPVLMLRFSSPQRGSPELAQGGATQSRNPGLAVALTPIAPSGAALTSRSTATITPASPFGLGAPLWGFNSKHQSLPRVARLRRSTLGCHRTAPVGAGSTDPWNCLSGSWVCATRTTGGIDRQCAAISTAKRPRCHKAQHQNAPAKDRGDLRWRVLMLRFRRC